MKSKNHRADVVVTAIIIGFYPDKQTLVSLIKSLYKQVNFVILVSNGDCEEVAKEFSNHYLNFHYIDLITNLGVGFALNTGFSLACELGSNYVATFDQDSLAPHSLIDGLLEIHFNLESQKIKCAAVGPAFYDKRQEIVCFYPFYKSNNTKHRLRIDAIYPDQVGIPVIEVDTLITSGMLVKTEAWKSHKYNSNYFIDYTDTEWCFRLRRHGWQLFGSSDNSMGHALSDSAPIQFLGLKFLKYSPLRRYYYFKNTVIFCKLDYVPSAWKRRLMFGLFIRFFINFIIDNQKILSFKMMLSGVVDGIRYKAHLNNL